jgi:hypothetical protein
LAQFCAGPESFGLSEAYKKSFKQQLSFIISKHPKYTWGGSTDLRKGIDCSGYLFLAAKWAGIPGVTRTTSQRMAMGLGGWIGRDIDFTEADECDLPFWTFRQDRPYGHVGVFLRHPYGMPGVTHASSTRGVVLRDLTGPLLRNLSKFRRLTIGE